MSSLSISVGVNGGREGHVFVSGSHIYPRKDFLAIDLLRSSFKGSNGVWLKGLERSKVRSVRKVRVFAKIKKGKKHDYPWPEDIDPNIESGHLSYLSHFKPLSEKPKPVTLAFEKPLVDLEKKIIDVRKMADETGLDFSDQISSLENKYQQALKDLYTHLTPIQRLNIARHPNRPTFLDHVLNISDKWVELHGDRAGYDDPAIVTGIGTIDGKSYMFIGHQKGRNTKENIARNFGMPTPHGYRKAKRMMEYADHHGLPIITFIDTPGAYADLKSEELGQGEAIAHNLRTMFGLRVPIVSVVIGEGGSGGALAIGCANKLFMLENSVFYVASPEACAAILWKTSQAAPKAAEKLKITAVELCKLKVADGIIPEPLGGAHTDPSWASQQIKLVVTKAMDELAEMDTDKLLQHRNHKFRILGGFQEGIPADPEKKRRMKASDVAARSSASTVSIEAEIENLKKKVQEAKGPSSGPIISDKAIEKLQQEVDQEITNAFISMGLQEKLESLKLELSKSSSNRPDQPLNPGLKEKVDKLMLDFKNRLSQPGTHLRLKQKLETLTLVNRLIDQKAKGEKLKEEVNQKLQKEVKQKMEILKRVRERVANGEPLDEDQKAEVVQAKAELKKALESANLKVVGSGKKVAATSPPDMADKIAEVEKEIEREIERAIDSTGLRSKIEELKREIGKGSSGERVGKLEEEIKEGIVAVMDLKALKEKVETGLTLEAIGADGSSGADNGRG
ncbi:acetyl-coenzyme A carboxylase carboxyl transferase subunit alpha, chloroplastic-like [Magnolia sinica]|uniref:acetyl-coenzyme A carboxylase carboxyl transferase subunit alpha, chloroplastic-like n=1 Tax=Magnolia sinica TaxID=86752 RepID=UPI00265A0F70|nr:acetyl-coenzyme A carboxylase carboxyl transferase subunit alpha, chloroplastic-like [Magnolia sinica]